MKPSVSVVITCYNQARFVGAAISSVDVQRPIEIIVVDDGSTDETATVVARFPGARYIRQENAGVVAARNRGLQECRGTYVVFLDGDDILLPDALATAAAVLDGAPDAAFVYGRCQMVDAEGVPMAHTSPPPSKDGDLYGALLRRNDIWMPGQVMHRRDRLMQARGFDARADHGSDLELYLRLARQFPIVAHAHFVAHWRQHSANTSRRLALMLRAGLRTMRSQRRYIRDHAEYEAAYREGLEARRSYYGGLLLDEVRQQARTRRDWWPTVKGTAALARHCPRVLMRYVLRKAAKSLSGR